jgi:type IV secretory pathway TrbD component
VFIFAVINIFQVPLHVIFVYNSLVTDCADRGMVILDMLCITCLLTLFWCSSASLGLINWGCNLSTMTVLAETIIEEVTAVTSEQVSIPSHQYHIKRLCVVKLVVVKPESMQ